LLPPIQKLLYGLEKRLRPEAVPRPRQYGEGQSFLLGFLLIESRLKASVCSAPSKKKVAWVVALSGLGILRRELSYSNLCRLAKSNFLAIFNDWTWLLTVFLLTGESGFVNETI
jgi:hypothetical protein